VEVIVEIAVGAIVVKPKQTVSHADREECAENSYTHSEDDCFGTLKFVQSFACVFVGQQRQGWHQNVSAWHREPQIAWEKQTAADDSVSDEAIRKGHFHELFFVLI